MKNIIYRLTKRNIMIATVIACLFAFVSNATFNAVGGAMFNAGRVSTANTMIDCLQLFFYVTFRLKIACKLDRFDLPFICGGVIAIVC